MSDRILRLALLLCLLIPAIGYEGCGGAPVVQPTPPPLQTEPPAAWVAYVQAQAHPLQSIDPLDTSFSDLAFLASLLEGRNIVELGESSNGVAEFSQTKVRLIRYLHEQLGYDVIAFDTSILSAYLANEQSSLLPPPAFMQNSLSSVWSTTDVVKLFSYILSTQGTAHPLILAGFDVQLTTPYESQFRPWLFQEVVGQVDPAYAQQVHDMDQAFGQNQFDNTYILANYATLKPAYQTLTAFLDANMTQIQSVYPTRPLFPLVVRQAAWGMGAYLDELYASASNDPVTANNACDAGRATNLQLLIDTLYSGKKVMVWALNQQAVHDASAIPGWGWKNMGKWISDRYGSQVYTIGLYMYQGSENLRGIQNIPPAPDYSVEGLLHTVGDPYVFLDISGVLNSPSGVAWMFQAFPIREWGESNMSMVLKNEYDGILQIDNVHPPTYVPTAPPPTLPTPPAKWVAYVQAQAHPLQSIDPDNTSSSDLAFLAPLLQGRNIVELGESGHGVAEFSQAKIRLIKYLHEQLGYDVMAFESSILSTYLANEQASESTPTAFMQDSIFAVWSTTDVVMLFSYIQSTQNTAHPLILAGFDVQLTTPYEFQTRPGIFQEVVSQVDPVYGQQVHDMDQAFTQSVYGNNGPLYIVANYATLKPKYQALTSFLDAHMTQIQNAYPTRPLFPLVVRQAAWGMGAYLDELYYSVPYFMTGASSPLLVAANSARDAGMATNLELLIDNLYAGKKVMVWAHNCHIAHDAAAVSNWGWKNTGNWIFQRYGQAVYTLGLYMYQGSADWNNRTVYTIPAAADYSVEGLLHAAGDPYVFLDISNVPDSNDSTVWMFENFLIRDWGVTNAPMILKNEYDGILQIDTVHPPTYVPTGSSSSSRAMRVPLRKDSLIVGP